MNNPVRDGMFIEADPINSPFPSPSGAASSHETPSGMAMPPRWGWKGNLFGVVFYTHAIPIGIKNGRWLLGDGIWELALWVFL
jgi:hypothetical protein